MYTLIHVHIHNYYEIIIESLLLSGLSSLSVLLSSNVGTPWDPYLKRWNRRKELSRYIRRSRQGWDRNILWVVPPSQDSSGKWRFRLGSPSLKKECYREGGQPKTYCCLKGMHRPHFLGFSWLHEANGWESLPCIHPGGCLVKPFWWLLSDWLGHFSGGFGGELQLRRRHRACLEFNESAHTKLKVSENCTYNDG